MEPADALPSVKPQTKDVNVVRRRRRSKGMPRRGAFVRGCDGLGGGGGISSTIIASGFLGVIVAILKQDLPKRWMFAVFGSVCGESGGDAVMTAQQLGQ